MKYRVNIYSKVFYFRAESDAEAIIQCNKLYKKYSLAKHDDEKKWVFVKRKGGFLNYISNLLNTEIF